MLRIGFDAKRAFNNLRGLGSYSRNLIDGMTIYNPINEYFLYGINPKIPACIQWFENIKGKVSVISPENNFKIFQTYWRSKGVIKNIRSDKLDIYHGLSHEIPFNSKSLKTKFVVTIHDLIFLYYKQYFNYFDREIYLSKIRHSCKNSDKIIAISEQTKSDLINLIDVENNKIEVIYQSCSPNFYTASSDEIKKSVKLKYKLPEEYLLFVGALVEHKNVLKIIDALSIIPEDKQIPLVIIGKGKDYREKIIERINYKKLSEKVKMIDYVDEPDMPTIYQMAKILVWPSLYEGFGIPIIEALFSNLPVITSRVGCFKEAAGKGSCFIDPRSAEEIAESIIKILNNNDLYSKMQSDGYDHVQKFHIEKTTSKLMNLYQTLV